MSNKHFGVWMDEHKAVIVVKENSAAGEITVIAHVENEAGAKNSSEKNSNNHERSETKKFFKEITSHMQNATQLHITGTGQAQEQFIHYLKDTPQFKNVKTEESTSNKMSDEKLVTFMASKFLN
jgi:stalled ribosome rescue protein Dom34